MKEIDWNAKHFVDLKLREFHDLLKLRLDVFVVEQNFPYHDLDGKDLKSFQIFGKNNEGEIIATCRVAPQGIVHNELCLGRFAVAKAYRAQNIAHSMMEFTLDFIDNEFGKVPVRTSAQEELESFFKKHDFNKIGRSFKKNDVVHIEMLKSDW